MAKEKIIKKVTSKTTAVKKEAPKNKVVVKKAIKTDTVKKPAPKIVKIKAAEKKPKQAVTNTKAIKVKAVAKSVSVRNTKASAEKNTPIRLQTAEGWKRMMKKKAKAKK